MWESFSLGLQGSHGKVGCEYVEKGEDGKMELYDTSHFKAKFRHLVSFGLVEEVTKKGEKTGKMVKKKYPFVDQWMSDERMDPRYLKDKTKKYYWERFDMYPNAVECPDDVYNLWSGFAAENMEEGVRYGGKLYADVRTGLILLLEHINMLCGGNAAQYDFLLNILAHAVQYPNVKLGIMLCLVGKQGCGKGHVWEMIERMVGSRACFTTPKPDKDVWGDNNGRMKDAFF
eukprot:2471243-Prymnesium_polylepis.1